MFFYSFFYSKRIQSHPNWHKHLKWCSTTRTPNQWKSFIGAFIASHKYNVWLWVFFVVKSGYHRRSIAFVFSFGANAECLSCCENLNVYKVGIIMQQYYVILYKQFLFLYLKFEISPFNRWQFISLVLFLLMELYLLSVSSDSALFKMISKVLMGLCCFVAVNCFRSFLSVMENRCHKYLID